MEGDSSQVEMKLSSDVDEEVGGNGVGDHLSHNANGRPYVVQKFKRSPQNVCFMAVTGLLVFIIGKRKVLNSRCSSRGCTRQTNKK